MIFFYFLLPFYSSSLLSDLLTIDNVMKVMRNVFRDVVFEPPTC